MAGPGAGGRERQCYYDPELQVFRPQRQSWSEMARMLVRYGIGPHQATAGQSRPLHDASTRAAGVAAADGGVCYAARQALLLFGAAWLAVALVVAVSLASPLSVGQRLLAGLLAPLVPLLYAAGQLIGWFRGWPGASAEVTVVENPR